MDYDNIYLSLKRKSEEAARRFAKEAGTWIRAIESGQIITPTNGTLTESKRRIVMNRCYGNPVPRRNPNDNSTDMNSFPFVRHHFLRAGFEVVDCPPLTQQLKNSADIRMVMDVRDYMTHQTHFDEFILLSGDADFTPVLHRLRAHARQTVIFANDYTAAPYTAISDGEIREADLIALLLDGRLPAAGEDGQPAQMLTATGRLEEIRAEIIAEIATGIRAAAAPVPLEALADRALRAIGHEKTIGTSWAGAGSFRELLRQGLPEDLRLTTEPPYFAYDPKRHGPQQTIAPPSYEDRMELPPPRAPAQASPASARPMIGAPQAPYAPPQQQSYAAPQAQHPQARQQPAPQQRVSAPATPAAAAPAPRVEAPTAVQKSIARIHEACQAPGLAPSEYRLLFEVIAQEINENNLAGAQTITRIVQRAQERGLDARKDDVRFVLEVVSEADPWFEQGASAVLFAGRFRNFVVARCRSQGINLSAEELDLIDAWFAGGTMPSAQPARAPAAHPGQQAPMRHEPAAAGDGRGGRWWSFDPSEGAEPRRASPGLGTGQPDATDDEFPRIVRTRLRG
ncbi:MAG: NYN domain-containing protein [Hyphomicrobiaceae bacterium]